MNKKLRLAEEFMREAWEELEKYKKTKKEMYLWQACGKGWAAAAQALKVINPEIKRHAQISVRPLHPLQKNIVILR